MAIFTAYLPPGGEAIEARFVSNAPSFFALILPAVFLLWHRLWWPLAWYALAAGALFVAGRLAGNELTAILSLLPGLFLFVHGRELLRNRLIGEGWRESAAISATNVEEAEIRFFLVQVPGETAPQNRPLLPVLPMVTQQRRPAQASIGMFPQ